MNKYISVKRAICICLILSCLMMCLNIYMKAYDRSNRKENLYFELLQLKLPIDTEVVKLESKQYLFGDVVLQCDFTLLPQNAFWKIYSVLVGKELMVKICFIKMMAFL